MRTAKLSFVMFFFVIFLFPLFAEAANKQANKEKELAIYFVYARHESYAHKNIDEYLPDGTMKFSYEIIQMDFKGNIIGRLTCPGYPLLRDMAMKGKEIYVSGAKKHSIPKYVSGNKKYSVPGPGSYPEETFLRIDEQGICHPIRVLDTQPKYAGKGKHYLFSEDVCLSGNILAFDPSQEVLYSLGPGAHCCVGTSDDSNRIRRWYGPEFKAEKSELVYKGFRIIDGISDVALFSNDALLACIEYEFCKYAVFYMEKTDGSWSKKKIVEGEYPIAAADTSYGNWAIAMKDGLHVYNGTKLFRKYRYPAGGIRNKRFIRMHFMCNDKLLFVNYSKCPYKFYELDLRTGRWKKLFSSTKILFNFTIAPRNDNWNKQSSQKIAIAKQQ